MGLSQSLLTAHVRFGRDRALDGVHEKDGYTIIFDEKMNKKCVFLALKKIASVSGNGKFQNGFSRLSLKEL